VTGPSSRATPLRGRTALVTGGGSGIGEAICTHFAAAGAAVAVLDRNGDAAARVSDQLARSGARTCAVTLDIAQIDRIDAALDEVEAALGVPDVVVNNAGVGVHAGFLDVTPELWDETHSINARGTFFMTQRTAARLVAQGRPGSIINVTSVVAERVWLASTAYAASKSAVRTFTEYAAAELGPKGIRVNALCPGPTDTPLSAPRYQDPGYRAGLVAVVPLRRIGTVDDLAKAAVFLAGDESAFTTGSTVYVDGGRRIG
jgi:NAD(P)-dependent dehydrogenase (short-subunit alcohol dehydrogenase family)